ncbi:MAG: formyltransferase [Planctomycetota bacterium]
MSDAPVMLRAPLRAVVLAYHGVGCSCLEALLAADVEVPAVYTHEDDPDETVWFGSVAALARDHGIPVHTPADINAPEWVARIRAQAPDIIFSFYYRKLVSREILDIPRLGAMNLHGSYLPRYRGRCPVNWVLVHGERETGVSLHYMVEKPDAGDIVAQRRIPIARDDTARTLHTKVAHEAHLLLAAALPAIRNGTNARIPQDLSAGSYFGGRGPDDGLIDWSRPAETIYNLVRAVTHPYPGAFTTIGGRKLFVWRTRPVPAGAAPLRPGEVSLDDGLRVGTGGGVLLLESCQIEGGEELGGAELCERHRIDSGSRFG